LKTSKAGPRTGSIGAALFSLLAGAVVLLCPSCAEQGPAESEITLPELPVGSRDYQVGIAGLVARNYPHSSEEDFRSFLDELTLMGERCGVYADWDSSYPLSEQVGVVITYSKVEPLAGIGFHHPHVDSLYFQTYGAEFRNAAVTLASEFDLDYLAVGAEVNRVRDECCDSAFDDFVDLYAEIYDAVKDVSPNTKVFTIFQLDYMRGAARLSGLDLEPAWDILELFEGRLDVVGLTVYPFLEYSTVGEIPLDYFDEIARHIDRPLVITESGWLSEPLEIGGTVFVEGSHQEQVDFLLALIAGVEPLNVEIMMYSFLYEYGEGIDMFQHIALRENTGPERPGYSYWRALAELPHSPPPDPRDDTHQDSTEQRFAL
jgi:hypothetical protein